MSDSSEDEASVGSQQAKWIPFSERAEWVDVKPVQQDEGPAPVVKIAYSSKCKLIPNSYFLLIWS